MATYLRPNPKAKSLGSLPAVDNWPFFKKRSGRNVSGSGYIAGSRDNALREGDILCESSANGTDEKSTYQAFTKTVAPPGMR